MKRIGALICLMIMVISVLAPSCFAAKDSAAASGNTNFKIVSSTPKDGEKDVSVENLSVKIYFDTKMVPESKAVRNANAKQFKLTDSNGHKIPIKVYYSHKEEGLMMVVSDIVDTDIKIKSKSDYTLTIGKNLKANDGTKLGAPVKLTFTTLDQEGSTKVYMAMMVVMMVGMVFFTSRSTKKAMEKENGEKGKSETVNPYKEAKRTGKSVEEIVAADNKRKAKLAEAEAKKQAKIAEIIEEELAKEKAANNKRVQGPKPISAAGSKYKVKVVKTQKTSAKKGNTNPKNQTGKQKNAKNKNKKKK